VPYYIANVRATIRLEDPIYFNKNAWISLIKQVTANDCNPIITNTSSNAQPAPQ
jgi:hypothetical protein